MGIVAAWSGRGLSDGTEITTATQGSGDTRWDTVTAAAFAVDRTGLHSPRIQVDQQAATEAQLIWDDGTLGTLGAHAVRVYVELSAWPGGNGRILAGHDASNALQWWLDVTSAGILRLRDPGGSAVDTSAVGLPTETEMRVEVVGDGTGNVTVNLYTGDGETPFDTLSGAGFGATVEQLRIGNPNTTPTWPTFYVDEVAVADTAEEIGPVPEPAAPPAATPKVELQLAGTWTDVSSYVLYKQRIKITRGRKKEGRSRLDNSTCALTLNNSDGRFSPRHPSSPYYGLLGRNTPIRVSLPYGSAYLRIAPADESQATAPDAAALDITGDLDVRADVDADQWRAGDLAGKYVTTGDQRSWFFGVETGKPELLWSPDGTFGSRLAAVATEVLPVTRGRLAVRAALDVDNGSSGWTVTFYTADTIAGPWTQLGDPVTGSGTTSVHAGTAGIEVGAVAGLDIAEAGNGAVPGKFLAFELRDGIDGTLVADPDFSAQTAGDGSFADAAGNTWTISATAVLDDRRYRFHGEVAEWPPSRDISGRHKVVQIRAAGISRRLKQGEATAGSAMYRAHTNPSLTSVQAYWPCEDGEGATQIASGRSDSPPMRIGGAPDLADYDLWTASQAMPTMATGRFAGTVAPYTPTGSIFVYMFVHVDEPPAVETSLLHLTTTGTARSWEVRMLTDGDLRTRAWDTDGAELTDASAHGLGDVVNFNLDGRGFLMLKLQLVENGSDIDWETSIIDFDNRDTIDAPTVTTGFTDTTLTGHTVGRVAQVVVGDEGTLGQTRISHIVVSDDVDRWLRSVRDAIRAHNGEDPADRLTRLCAEEEIPFVAVTGGVGGNVVALGDQVDRAFVDLLEEAAAADGGIPYEARDMLGLAYRTRLSLYNQPALLTLSCADHQLNAPLEPVYDDHGRVNDIVVERIDGSSVHVEEASGPLSVLPPASGGVGRYDTKVDLSLEGDGQLPDQASWRLHLGTVDEARYPKVTVHLAHPAFAGDADLKTAALAVDVGDRLVITDPSPDLPPDDISLLAIGYSETLDQFEHVITYVCQPESPWHVAVVGTAGFDRLDTAGSELATGVDSDDTSLSVATTTGPLWTTAAGDLPMDVVVGGERVTVTAVSGTSSPQTFTVTRSVNGVEKAHSAGAAVTIAEPVYIAL